MALYQINNGWLRPTNENMAQQAPICYLPSPHFSKRPQGEIINLLVVHNISLPPGEFGGPYINDLFLGRLDKTVHPYFIDIADVQVSAHCLIRRDGSIVQYVSFNDMAWHAGVSSYQGRAKCNNFSIGIELEGTDDIPYTQAQYQQLSFLSQTLFNTYPQIVGNIVGHCDIAPIRKTDPGQAFDWQYYNNLLTSVDYD